MWLCPEIGNAQKQQSFTQENDDVPSFLWAPYVQTKSCREKKWARKIKEATYMKFRTPLVNIHKTWQWTIQHFSWNIIYSTNRDMPVCIMRVNKWCGWAGTPNIMPKTTHHPCSLQWYQNQKLSQTAMTPSEAGHGRSTQNIYASCYVQPN
jgi:hypothetical protein